MARPKYTLEEVRKIFKDGDCELISTEYQDANKLLDYRCECKRISKIRLSNFIRGVRCYDGSWLLVKTN